MNEARWPGGIGERQENGFPVIYKFSEFHSEEARGRFGWLTVVSWQYGGSQRNGMPTPDVNDRMLVLDHAIDDLEKKGQCLHAYSRTGNSLKEFAFYISNRDRFMEAFNEALKDEPLFPIEITFYEDPGWKDFQTILEIFRQTK